MQLANGCGQYKQIYEIDYIFKRGRRFYKVEHVYVIDLDVHYYFFKLKLHCIDAETGRLQIFYNLFTYSSGSLSIMRRFLF